MWRFIDQVELVCNNEEQPARTLPPPLPQRHRVWTGISIEQNRGLHPEVLHVAERPNLLQEVGAAALSTNVAVLVTVRCRWSVQCLLGPGGSLRSGRCRRHVPGSVFGLDQPPEERESVECETRRSYLG